MIYGGRTVTRERLLDVIQNIRTNLQPQGGQPYLSTKQLENLDVELKALEATLTKQQPNLLTVKPDFYSLVDQLENFVKAQETWSDFDLAGVGQTLLEMVAAVGELLQVGLEVAVRETWMGTAIRDSSIYAATQHLGVRVSRKTPAMAPVWLVRQQKLDQNLEIGRYTKFVIDGRQFFNADDLVFPSGETTLPIGLSFDSEGNPKAMESRGREVAYPADIRLEGQGLFHFPIDGTLEITNTDGRLISGRITLVQYVAAEQVVYGTLTFDDSAELLTSESLIGNIYFTLFNGTKVQGTLRFPQRGLRIKCPVAANISFKVDGLGMSFKLPAQSQAFFPVSNVLDPQSLVKPQAYQNLLPTTVSGLPSFVNTIYLLEGEVLKKTLQGSDDSGFLHVRLSEPGFVVADQHFRVRVNEGGLWREWQYLRQGLGVEGASPDAEVFTDYTTKDGDTVLVFGNGINGKKVTSAYQIEITYARTSGRLGNYGQDRLRVDCQEIPNLYGETLKAPAYGTDEKPAQLYKVIAPAIRHTGGLAVNPKSNEAVFLNQAGVADVALLYQRDYAPNDIRMMNTVKAVLLYDSPRISAYPKGSLLEGQAFDPSICNPQDVNEPNQWVMPKPLVQALKEIFSEVSFAGLEYDYSLDPIPLPIILQMRVYVKRGFSLEAVKTQIAAAIRPLFQRRQGILGRTLKTDDIIGIVKQVEGVDGIDLISPAADVLLGSRVEDRYTFICLKQPPEISVEYATRRGQQ